MPNHGMLTASALVVDGDGARLGSDPEPAGVAPGLVPMADRLELSYPPETGPCPCVVMLMPVRAAFRYTTYGLSFAVDAVPALWSGPAVAALCHPADTAPARPAAAQLGPVRPSVIIAPSATS